MCRGTATYYLKCGHSAVVWVRCFQPQGPFCHPSQAGEAYKDDRCNYRWCPCDNRIWACCRCSRLNLWADCASCAHLRCAICRSSPTGDAFGVPNFQDQRYVQWRRRQLEQEQRRRGERLLHRPSGSGSGGERADERADERAGEREGEREGERGG